MSDDALHDLAELVADAKALLQAEQALGVRADSGLELPQVDVPAAAVAPPATVAKVASLETPNRWSKLAAEGRELSDAQPQTLEQVREDLGDCRRCGLCSGRRNIVFGSGDPHADLLIVGEGPGAQEDRSGVPFVGPAGELLDQMLRGVLNLGRDEVYVANVVKCQPPGNRNPLPLEVTACLPFLERQIAAVRPKVLLIMGNVAFKSLFNTTQGITAARGRWTELHGVPALPTFHPAYLLRKPEDKRLSFEDLKACSRRYAEVGGKRLGPAKPW